MRTRTGADQLSIIMTGWGMSAHEQALMISSKVSPTPGPSSTQHQSDPRALRILPDSCWRFAHSGDLLCTE